VFRSQTGFAALEDFDAEEDINSSWKTIKENTKISAKAILGYYELNKYKLWFDEEYYEIVRSKETKFLW
jgi:hypothetical protein